MMLCDRFGFDQEKLSQQLRLVGLGEDDHALVESLHRHVITPYARAVVGRFYQVIKRDQRFWEVMSRGFSLKRLHRLQLASLQSFGRDFDTFGYFERRLRIGVAHAKASVPLELYLGAYRVLTEELMNRLPATRRGDAYRALVLKLMMLDISLVSSTFHLVDMADIKQTLVRTRGEVDVQRERARRDSLTQVYNRDHLGEVLETTVEAAQRTGRPMAVAMIDIDRFKPVNDLHGHPVGDEVLREVVKRMRLGLRETDTLGRYGGDEFLLVLDDVQAAEAHEIVERLRVRVAKDPFHVDDERLPVTISAGVAMLGIHGDAKALLNRADAALYRAKKHGRNQVVFDNPRSAITLDRFPAASRVLEKRSG